MFIGLNNAITGLTQDQLSKTINSLFSKNEQGVWYDPSDFSTMYQDAAGTTPVTAVEQPVGLILDKSKGLMLGPELIVNSAWTTSTGWSVDTSTGVATAIAATGTIRNKGTGGSKLIAGKWYQATIRLVSYVSGSVGYPYDGTGFTSIPTTPGTYTYRFLCDIQNDWTYVYCNAFTGVVDNISVRELPGNHATQSTTTSRPQLSARVNLLTKTEQFDDAAWFKMSLTISANTTVAPDGTTTAETMTDVAATSAHFVYKAVSTLVSVPHTASVYVKQGAASYVIVGLTGGNLGAHWAAATVNLGTGSITQTTNGSGVTGVSSSIVSVGSGWYRVTVTATSSVETAFGLMLEFSDTATPSIGNYSSYSYLGTGSNTAYIWGADLRAANDALNQPAYQRVNTATDYDTAGFPMYLRFDGVDDFLQTNSIDFTATNKMTVCAGVRKLSDATGFLAELSAERVVNNGAWSLLAPGGLGVRQGYYFSSKGTLDSPNGVDSGYASPITNILTGLGDISGDLATLRVNGTQAASSTADQGTGNYGNYPLYIGRRGGTTFPFNGQLYGLVIRGALSSTGEIQGAESYMNLHTGAY